MMMIRKILLFGRRQLHTIISREIIAPSSPTPSHLHTYKLSQLEQGFPHSFMPLFLFYPNNGTYSLNEDDKARELKKSFSHSLTQYYPFAGRLHTPTTPYIDCNDEGVVFVEAKHDNQLEKLQHMINEEEDDTVGQLFADNMVWLNSLHSTSLLGVQLNHFACGGSGVAVSMSHKIGDACTLASYVRFWASVARYGSIDHKTVVPLHPDLIQSSSPISSTGSNSLPGETSVLNQSCKSYVTRKFVFSNSKLNSLKKKVLDEAGSTLYENNPTRFEVLASLIYKTAVAAKSSGCVNPSFLLIPVDMRRKFVPKMPQTTVGNFISLMMVTTMHESEILLSRVVSEIKKEKMEVEQVQSQELVSQKFESIMSRMRNDTDFMDRCFWCSSLFGFPYNEVNFG